MLTKIYVLITLFLLLPTTSTAQLSIEHFGNLNVNAGLTRVMNDATRAASKKAPDGSYRDGAKYRTTSNNTKQNRQALVTLVKKSNPDAVPELERVLAENDIIEMFSKDMAPYGLDVGNVADAVTAFLVANWMIANQADNPSPSNVAAVRGNIAHAMGPSMEQLDNRQRQFLAELLIYQTMFAIGARTAATTPERSQILADNTHQSMLSMGLDMRNLQLSDKGLTQK